MTAYSSLASVAATRTRLAELGLATKKSLGQHFLIDDGVVGKILRLADLSPEQRVVEVGPGIGTLSEALLATGAELTAVELDSRLLAGLNARYPSLRVLGADALDPATLTALKALEPQALVSNLPYAVAATIILAYFQELPSLQSATVMVQREVAERIMATVGTKSYGAYTVKLQLYARVAGHFGVSPQSFYPPPRVSSTVLRLERHPQQYAQQQQELLANASRLADAAFFQRRKTLRNSLGAYFAQQSSVQQGSVQRRRTQQDCAPLDFAPQCQAEQDCVSQDAAPQCQAEQGCAQQDGVHQVTSPVWVDSLLAACNINPSARGETLAVEDFLALALFSGATQKPDRPR